MNRLFSRTFALLLALSLLACGSALAAKKRTPHRGKAPVTATQLNATAQPAARAAALPVLSGPGPHLVRLKNGLSVLIKQDDRFPLVNIRMLVHAGSGYETRDQAGISHVLEHMVFKGAGIGPSRMGPGEVATRIESVGGNLNASTSFDVTTYYVEVPDTAWKMGMGVVSDMTFRPTLDPKELESEKEVVLAELKRGEDSPGTRLFHTLQGMVWKGSSYEWPVIGYTDTVRAVTSQSLRAYTGGLYQPQNMLLCVVGKVDPAKVLAEAERLLSNIPNTRPYSPPDVLPAPKADGPRLTVIPGEWNKVHLGIAFPAPDFLSSKMAGLDLLAQVLGGDETSRLYRTFKYEKRLVDSISVGNSNLERSGLLMIDAVLDADKLPAFWDALTQELAHFDPATITDQELARARTNIEASLFLAKETIGGLSGKISHQYFFEGGPQGEANYLEGLSSPSRAHLSSLYHEFFRPGLMSVAVLAPKGVTIDEAPLKATLAKRWPNGPTKAATEDAKAGNVRQIALPGGSTLVLIPDATLPYTALSMAWRGGDGLVAPSQQGLGSITASLLTRGTTKKSANQIEDFLADRAASLGASAGTESFSLSAKFPSRFSKDLLGLISETLTSPAFANAELSRAREDQLSAIKRSEDQPIGLVFRNLPGILYSSTPHSYQRLGTAQSLSAMTATQAGALWKRQSRQPFVLSVCGQFDEAAITEFATKLEKQLKVEPGLSPFITPAWKPNTAKTLHLPGRKQTHLFVIFKTPGRDDLERSAQLSVLRAALAGQSGLLFRDMRDKQGLGYTVTAFLSQGIHSGFMAFYIGTDPDKRDQAFAGFKKAAANLVSTDLPAVEMERAKNILSGEYYQERQALQARSGEAAGALVAGLPLEAGRELVERSATVTAEQVRQAAAAVLKWDDAFVVEVEP